MVTELAVIGAASKASLAARLPLIAARARAGAAAGKALADFVRESGRDWPSAPCRIAVVADSLEELAEKLALAADLLDGDPKRLEASGIFYGATAADRPSIPPASICSIAEPATAPASSAPTVESAVLAIFARLTGYETADADDDLAADLAVDSIKHAQVVEAVWDHFGIARDDSLTIADHPTLRHMMAFVSSHANSAEAPPEVPSSGSEPLAAAPAQGWHATVVSEDETRIDLDLASRVAVPMDAREVAEHGLMPRERRLAALAVRVAGRELVARRTGEAVSSVRIEALSDGSVLATTAAAPLTAHPLSWRLEDGRVHVRSAGAPRLHLDGVIAHWRSLLRGAAPSLLDVSAALTDKFLGGVHVEDPDALAAVRGQPLIYVSNHQTAIETFFLPLVECFLGGTLVLGVDMRDHGIDWADSMRQLMYGHGDLPDEMRATSRTVDTADPSAMLRVLPELEGDLAAGGRSLHIAVTGLRELAARHVLSVMSAVWIDLALAVGCPVVPVRILGGLPLEGTGVACDLPVGLGTQRIHFGAPIPPADLAALHPRERTGHVLGVLNRLGRPEREEPHPADEGFARAVGRWAAHAGAADIAAVLLQALDRHRNPDVAVRGGDHVFENPVDALVAAARLSLALEGPVALVLPETADGVWLSRIASLTFGERGPRVCTPRMVPSGMAACVRGGWA